MFYRETGQFKTSYTADMAIFPIRQDRIALWVLLIVAFIGVPLLDAFQIWPLRGEYLLRAILIPFLILSLAAVGLNISLVIAASSRSAAAPSWRSAPTVRINSPPA